MIVADDADASDGGLDLVNIGDSGVSGSEGVFRGLLPVVWIFIFGEPRGEISTKGERGSGGGLGCARAPSGVGGIWMSRVGLEPFDLVPVEVPEGRV